MSEYLLTGIGRRIKSLRMERTVKLTELAELADISKGLLSKIENGRTVPSLPVLLSIIRALDIPPDQFFRDLHFDPPKRYVHRSADEMALIQKEDGARGFNYWWILDRAFEHFSMEVVMLEIMPGSQRKKVSTDAFELKYVLEGEINYQIDEEFIYLRKGDSLLYDGRIPHVPHNQTDRPAKMLVVYLYYDSNRKSK